MVRGMKDMLPADERYWDVLEEQANRAIDDYSFKRINTPILEKYELFNHALYKQHGALEKESFNFIDHGEKLIMRPEITASVARAYIEHNMANQLAPVKLYSWGSVFRQSRGDERRLREFTQLNFEILGDGAAAIDAELIIVAYYFLKNMGLDVEVRLNSLGCLVCRLEYSKALGGYLKNKRAAICADCRRRSAKEPVKFLTCANAKCQALKEDAPQTVDWLCDECRNHLFRVLEYLDELKIPYTLDSTLLRTFDYYTKTIFEIRAAKGDPTDPIVLAGGGRFDYLLEMLGGPKTPAAGFSLGAERVISQMKNDKVELPPVAAPDVFVAQIGEVARQKVFAFFESLRRENFSVKANFSKSSLKAQLDLALKLRAKLVLILGQKEVSEGTVLLRDVDSGIQEVINFAKAISEIKKRLKEMNK